MHKCREGQGWPRAADAAAADQHRNGQRRDTMALTSQLSADGSVCTIRVSGQFNFNVYQQFRDAYRDVGAEDKRFVIDLAGTDYMDSSALGMLLLLREFAGGERADIEITSCRPEIRKIFRIANFERLFRID
jgi:anti-anti-sigma factor